MIACKKCQTANGLDHKFCKSCGASLPEDAVREATEKHEQLVQEGYSLFNAGRTDEAFLVAQAATGENSESTNALTLLGMCFERSGQLAEALECFEKVVSLNPESALDRMKVTQLRAGLTSHMQTSERANRRVALIASASVLVICVVAGLIIEGFTNRQSQLSASTLPSAQSAHPVVDRPFDPVVTSNKATDPVSNTAQAAASQAATTQTAAETTARGVPRPLSSGASATGNGTSDLQIDPVPVDPKVLAADSATAQNDNASVAASPMAQSAPQGAQNVAQSSDPAPAPYTAASKNAASTPQDPGVIEISVVPQSASSAPASGNELQALMNSARSQFLAEDYGLAAKTYEKALAVGGDAALVNQRLGMCYQRLGRSEAAISAYSKAASAYEVALNSGRGDSRRLKSAFDSCEQAIKLLKG